MKTLIQVLKGSIALPLVAALAVGCASPSRTQHDAGQESHIRLQAPTALVHLFGDADAVVPFSDLVGLTPIQEQEFLDWFHAAHRSHVPPHHRVAEYLQNRLKGVLFDHQTLGAADTLIEGKGNCVSLALVTTAVARLAGIENDWRLTMNNPIYSADGSLVFSSNHVHTRLFDPSYSPQPGQITLVRPMVVVDYFTDQPSLFGGRTLNEPEMIALVYQNLAAEALGRRDLASSLQLALTGLGHDPDNAELYNLLGVLHQRQEALSEAESFFRHSLALDRQLSTLRNLEALLLRMERPEEARRISRQIQAMPDSDPFPFIQLGDRAFADGRLNTARRYYRQAHELAPYLPKLRYRIAMLERDRAERSTELSLQAAMAKTSMPYPPPASKFAPE